MKKFLAALLAVVMVVSLVPAAVFAADGDCAVQKTFGVHTKAYCDLLGVKYTQTSETVAPECGQDGYTMYKCACGVYFADDIIDMPEHAHADGAKPVSERVEPTCNAYGKAAVYTCMHCNKQYPEYASKAEADAAAKDTSAPAGAIVKLKHKFNTDSYGVDCTAKKQTCTVCGETVTNSSANKSHSYNYSDPHAIITVPGTCTPGAAVFKCTRENCEKTTTVEIDPAGHNPSDMDHEPAKPAKDCTSTGVKEHWICDECDVKYFYNEDGEFVPATDDDLVIEMEHLDPIVLDSREPACGVAGWITYKCRECNSKSWTEDFPAGPDCTTLEEVLKHDAELEEGEEKWLISKVDNGCNGVTYTWICHNLKCGSAELNEEFGYAKDEIHGEPIEWTDPATEGHDEYVVKVPATLEYPYSYTLVFCTNPECVEKANAPQGENYVSEEGSREAYKLNVSVLVYQGNVYEMTPAEQELYTFVEVKNIKEVKLTQKANCSGYAHYYWHDADQNHAATCTDKGYEKYICTNSKCLDDQMLTTDAIGHTPDYYNALGKSDGYTCGKACKLYCLECGKSIKSVTAANAAHVKTGEKLEGDEYPSVPNCQSAGGDWYECLYCGKAFIAANKKTYAYTNSYDSYEAAELAHAQGVLTKTGVKMDGDCEIVGKVEWKCSECDKKFWVRDVENTGHHVAPKGTKYYEEANCLHGAGYETYDCVNCGETVEAESALPHNLTKTAKKAATCYAAGNEEYYVCSNECCWYKTVVDGEEVMVPVKYKKVPVEYIENGLKKTKDTYVDYRDTDAGTEVIAKLSHKYEKKGSAPVSCMTAGYEYWVCKNCSDKEIRNVVEATGHTLYSETPYEIPADCVNDGAIFYYCSNDWCTGYDGLIETEKDNGIYTDKDHPFIVVPALGHINQAGQKVVDSCLDTTKDRACVRANCPLEAATSGTNKGKKIVPQSHDKIDGVLVPATCETPAYYLTTCKNGCGKINEVVYDGDALGHKFAWGDIAGVDYVNARDIEAKGNEFLANAKAFKAAHGDEAIIAYTPATYEKNGSITFKCANCGNKVTMDVVKAGIDFTLNVDNAVKPGTSYTYDVNGEIDGITIIDGEVIAVDIDMSAFETKVWGFNFEVNYIAASMNFLGYKFHAGEKFANYKVNNIVEDYKQYDDVNNDGVSELVRVVKDAYGTVKVSAYTENAIDGTMFDATVTGTEKVVTLYFQVEDIYEYTELGVDDVDYVGEIYLSLYEISVTNTEDEVDAYGDFFGAYVDEMMDTNVNGNFNITDVQNCVKIIKGQADVEYMAAADVNKDGAVNLTDLDLMNKYLVGEVDAFEIYKALSWNAPEGFVAA